MTEIHLFDTCKSYFKLAVDCNSYRTDEVKDRWSELIATLKQTLKSSSGCFDELISEARTQNQLTEEQYDYLKFLNRIKVAEENFHSKK